MSVDWKTVELMEAKGLFRKGIRVLDIGTSTLSGAEPAEVTRFILKYNPNTPLIELPILVNHLAADSKPDRDMPGNRAFLGEMLEAAGMEYTAFDIVRGFNTEIVDLNTEELPEDHAAAYDFVLNIDSTAHIFNQLNCFRAIHDAVKPGGRIYHRFPAIGWSNQCYFTYGSRFIFELGQCNSYRIGDFWFSMEGESRLGATAKEYALTFPGQAAAWQANAPHESGKMGLAVPNIYIHVIFQRTSERPFAMCLDKGERPHEIPGKVLESY